MSKDDDEKGGPLGFLDRLLDEERDSNLHFGDVRFWKHLEHINIAHVYRTTSLEYRTMKMMFCETVFYIVFIMVLTSFVVMQRSPDLYASRRQQLDYWAGCKRTWEGRSCKIDEVTDPQKLMTWLSEDFVPKAFTEQDQYLPIAPAVSMFRLQSGNVRWTPRYVGDTKTSILTGTIRIRQLRVQYNLDCTILQDFLAIHKDCFPKYSPGVESKLKWHPTWTPEHVKPHYKWYDANETEQGDTVGYHGVYPGSGFVLDLPLNLTGARMRLKELEEWSWLDVRTRAVVIEMNTLNPNVNIFVNTKLLFEFPATGGVYIKQEASSFRAIQMSLALAATDDSNGTFAMLILTTGLFLMLFVYVSYLMMKNGAAYFTYFWSVIDFIILVLFFVLVCIYLSVFSQAEKEPNLQPEVLADPEMFFPIGKLIPDLEFSNTILACLGLAAWLKVLKYFTLSGWFMGFVRVIERCIVNLLLFASLLFLVLFGFAVALHVGYGADDNLFYSIWGSFIAVVVAPAGGVDLEPIFAPGDLLGPILVFLYIIVVFLLLLNTFMAISVDTYSVCMYEISQVKDERKQQNPTLVFLNTYLNALMGIKLVGKETEEDRGDSHEQEIALTALPEAVQIRWMEEKRKMQSLLQYVQAQIDDEERKRQEPELYNTTMTEGDEDDDPLPPQQLQDFNPPPPEDGEMHTMVVKRVQLQRMLEDYPVMQEICGTERAVDIIRKFRVDLSGGDPYAAVAELQANIAAKLKELEDKGMDLTFDEMEALKTVSQELHSALTESQKEWRSELLSVLQMASLLSKALIDLTTQLAKVQYNHSELSSRASPK